MAINTLDKKNRPVEVFLVEDNPDDVRYIQKAFENIEMPIQMTVAEDGNQAVQMLMNQSNDINPLFPDIILLDINLPKLNGKQVLEVIKQHETLKYVPVIMLTSSSAEVDVVKSYQSHANAFIVKPLDGEKFNEMATAIEMFWLRTVTFADQQEIASAM